MSVPMLTAAVSRQPIVDRHGTVSIYSLAPLRPAEASPVYSTLDLSGMAGERQLMVHVTPALLERDPELLRAGPTPLVVELAEPLPSVRGTRDLGDHLVSSGHSLALGHFTGASWQNDLLDLARYVKVDARTDPITMSPLLTRAHAAGCEVIAEHTTSHALAASAHDAGCDYLQGPLLVPRTPGTSTTPDLRHDQEPCLQLLQLLGVEQLEHVQIAHLVAIDPKLSARVLALVNSSVLGLSRHISSAEQAVVLAGPQHMAALACAGLLRGPSHTDRLWATLCRARALATLTRSASAYMLGLLSAIDAHGLLPTGQLIARSGAPLDAASALTAGSGPLAPPLAAVLAYERNDGRALRATGLSPAIVCAAYLDAVPRVLVPATALSTSTAT